MIDIKKAPYGRDSKSYQIRLDGHRTDKLTKISEQADVRPTTAATQLLEAAIDRQFESVAGRKANVLSEEAESALRKLLAVQPGAYENGGFSDNPMGGTPYSRLDVVMEKVRDILAKDNA